MARKPGPFSWHIPKEHPFRRMKQKVRCVQCGSIMQAIYFAQHIRRNEASHPLDGSGQGYDAVVDTPDRHGLRPGATSSSA